jgi:hypothetical protein
VAVSRIGQKPKAIKREQAEAEPVAVAALAADPLATRKNGGIYTTRALSEEYGFTDLDGARPDYAVLEATFEQAKETYLAPLVEAGRFANVDWKLASKTEGLS